MNNKLYLILGIFLLIGMTSALTLTNPTFDTHLQSQDYEFIINAFNESNGQILNDTTTNCTISIYNMSNGSLFLTESMNFNYPDYKYLVLGNNFTAVGNYSSLFYCNNSDTGNNLKYNFEVIKNLNNIDSNLRLFNIDFSFLGNYIFLIILFSLSIFLYIIKNYLFSGFVLMITSLLLLFNEVNIIISLIIFVVGVITLTKESKN